MNSITTVLRARKSPAWAESYNYVSKKLYSLFTVYAVKWLNALFEGIDYKFYCSCQESTVFVGLPYGWKKPCLLFVEDCIRSRYVKTQGCPITYELRCIRLRGRILLQRRVATICHQAWSLPTLWYSQGQKKLLYPVNNFTQHSSTYSCFFFSTHWSMRT